MFVRLEISVARLKTRESNGPLLKLN
jgi:hypothetical protein